MTEEKNKIDNLDINEKNTVTILISICEYCGKVFIPNKYNPNQKYCCKSCSSRKYRQEHKEEIKEYNKKYDQEHKEEIKEYSKKHRQEHKEEIKKYRQEHKEEIKKYNKKYDQEHKEERRERRRKYYQEHKEEERERSKRYRQEHKEEIMEYNKKYRLRTYKYKLGWSKIQFYEMYPTYRDYQLYFYTENRRYKKFRARILEIRGYKCKICGKWGDEIDHLNNVYKFPEIALDPNNVQVLCVECHNIRTKERLKAWEKRKARGWS